MSKNNCVIINHTINRQSCYGFDVKKGIYSCSLFGASFLRCEIFLCNLVPNFGGYDYWRLFKLQWIVRLYRSQRWKSLEVCKKVQVLHLMWFISKIDMIRNKIYRSRFSRIIYLNTWPESCQTIFILSRRVLFKNKRRGFKLKKKSVNIFRFCIIKA